MKSEAELKAVVADTMKHLHRIENVRRRKTNRKYKGKCFRYQNTYGSAGGSWPLYLRIKKAGYYLEGHKFEITASGRFESWCDPFIVSLDGWTEISHDEFQAAWKKFLTQLEKLPNQ